MFEQAKWLAVIQGNHWVVAKVKKSKSKLKILKIAEYTMEMDSNVEVSLNLRQWLQKEKVPLKRLNIAFSCQGVITRMITLPIIPLKDLKILLTEQVAQYFTLNIEDYVVDYRIIDTFEEEGQKRQHVLLAALPRFQWEPLWNLLREVGVRPKTVDLSADCLSRLYGQISIKSAKLVPKEQPLAIEDIAIVDLGRERIEFVLLEKGLFFLYSDLLLSLEELRQMLASYQEKMNSVEPASLETASLMDQADIGSSGVDDQGFDEDQIENTILLKIEPASYELESSEEYSSEAYLRSEVELALMPVLRMLEEFMNFFAARHFGKPIDHIYITGEYADLPFLEEIFKVNLEIKTNIGFPREWKASFGKGAGEYRENWMKYGSLYGLALRED